MTTTDRPVSVRPKPLRTGGVPPIRIREIDLNLTNFCNLECIHCSYSSTKSKHEPALTAEVIKGLLTEAAGLGTKVVHWSGGEPATRPDMAELIAHAIGLGYGMRLLSNGILLNESRLQSFWDAGLRKVLISMDGLEEHHDHHRQHPGLWDKTLNGIRNAVRMGFHTRVNAAATTDNVDDMVELARRMHAEGVHTFTVFYLITVGRGSDIEGLQVPPDRWRRLMDDMAAVAAELRAAGRAMEVTVEKVFSWSDDPHDDLHDEHLASGRGGGCLGFLNGCDYVNILADGGVYPCVCFVDKAPALGNINERPLGEILHDPASWQFYWGLTGRNETCSACSMVDVCGGGSRAASFTDTGDWFSLDPRCSGDPVAQGFIPVCFMLREDVTTRSQSGFAEAISPELT